MERWVAAAGDLLLGASCHGCGAPWWGICPQCREVVATRRAYRTEPDPVPPGFPVTVTSSPYDAVLQHAITAHKDRQALALTGFLADRLAISVHGLLSAYGDRAAGRLVTLVPVPSAAAVVRQRGFDATWALARLTARRLRGSHRVSAQRLLEQRRRVADQSGLDANQRAANLQQAFRLRGAGGAGPVVLVDDIVTTGSSLTEAARALRRAGFEVLGAATIAATVRRRPPRG
jgi:predicted amidophosphoribosyltransferase